MRNAQVKNLLRFVQWVTLTFIIVLGGLMAHDAIRAGQTLDVTRGKLDTMKLKDMDDPELSQAVRDLDYLYRATYFQAKDRRAYAFLLLGCGFFLLCGTMILERFLFAPELQIPTQNSPLPTKERRELLIFSTCGLLLLCGILIVLRMTRPNVPPVTETIANVEQDTNGETPMVSENTPAVAVEREEISLAVALEEELQQWPQFRGSVLPNQNTLPKNWDFSEKWRATIPLQGFNSPVVWDDNIFLAGGDKTERAVFCFDANDGSQRWKLTCTEATEYPKVDDQTGISAPTLCVDKHRVYGIFATGEMICCTHDGEIVWKKQMPTPDILYGYASSPLLLGNRLIVQYDMSETQTIYALDVYTGNVLWQTDRQSGSSWSSPTALIRDGKTVIFVVGHEAAHLLDAETGEVLWTHEEMGGEIAASAFATDNAFYYSNEYAFTGAFSVDDGSVLFQNEDTPPPDVASSVVLNDVFFLFTSIGSAFALDAKTGEELYEHDFGSGFYASPVILQDKLVAVNMDGELFLLNGTKEELTIKGTYSLGTEVVAIPAFHKGNIIIRTSDKDLICLEGASE
jgi:PQQ enzyme repeat.